MQPGTAPTCTIALLKADKAHLRDGYLLGGARVIAPKLASRVVTATSATYRER